MELRHLRSFVTVAEERHFGRAARKLHLSQPPLSNQIKKLEEEVGVRLLSRTTHGVTLTHSGRVLLEEARKVIEHADRALVQVQRAARGEMGSVSIGFVAPIAIGILPGVLRLFRERFPDAEVELKECSTPAAVSAVAAGELDVSFVFGPIDRLTPCETFLRDPWLLAVPATHSLAKKKIISREDLRGQPILMAPRSARPELFDRTIAWFNEAGITPQIAQEIPTLQALMGLVASSCGICFVPQSCRRLRCDGVSYRPLLDQLPPLEVAIVWQAEATSPLADGLRAMARQAVEGLARAEPAN